MSPTERGTIGDRFLLPAIIEVQGLWQVGNRPTPFRTKIALVENRW